VRRAISTDHDVINLPISLLTNEHFLKLTSRSIDLLFALAYRKYANRSAQHLSDLLGMRVTNLYRERSKLRDLGFIQLNDGNIRVSFPLDFEIIGSFHLPCFLVQERLSTEEWRLVLALYRIAHERNSATFEVSARDLCPTSGVNEKNLARVRRELIGKGLLLYSKTEYSLRDPVTQEGVDKVFGLEP
jgi:hypothetical protein